jgi:hypothetical protein
MISFKESRFVKQLLSTRTASKLLFTMVLLTIFFVPLIPVKLHPAVYNMMFTSILILGTQLISKKRITTLFFVIIAVSMVWIADAMELEAIMAISKGINILLFILIVFDLGKQVSMANKISTDVILEAVIAYLMIGLAFSLMVALTLIIDPRAYNLGISNSLTAQPESPLHQCVYYAFITMTTTGYGDIVPTNPMSRSLAIFISVTGQLYVAIVIALLIGKYISQQGHTGNTEK